MENTATKADIEQWCKDAAVALATADSVMMPIMRQVGRHRGQELQAQTWLAKKDGALDSAEWQSGVGDHPAIKALAQQSASPAHSHEAKQPRACPEPDPAHPPVCSPGAAQSPACDPDVSDDGEDKVEPPPAQPPVTRCPKKIVIQDAPPMDDGSGMLDGKARRRHRVPNNSKGVSITRTASPGVQDKRNMANTTLSAPLTMLHLLTPGLREIQYLCGKLSTKDEWKPRDKEKTKDKGLRRQ
ncbi:hypothetical protein JB92DRAFT_3104249 [Gautieria morchelliformis]|nr:hypothetical protein JB92DRAFT_3104249 [Gautieria morchelliformis]